MSKGIAKAYMKRVVDNHNLTQSKKPEKTEKHPRRRDQNDHKFTLKATAYTRNSQCKIHLLQ